MRAAIIPEHYLKPICRIGEGAVCCRYVVAGSKGIECAKFDEVLQPQLDARVAAGTIMARGDNCHGFHPIDI